MASISRGKFLKSLGASVSNLAVGAGLAVAAQALSRRSSLSTTILPSGEPELPIPEFIRRGNGAQRQIALTFDDGPVPGLTESVLDKLQRRSLHATFFMIGREVASAPDLAWRVLAEGHEIGNHTFTHQKLTTLPDSQVEKELRKTQEVIMETAGRLPRWFRPPYGEFRRNQMALASKEKLDVVLWNVDSRDWSPQGPNVEMVLENTEPGSIICCHDSLERTIHCLDALLEGLLEREFTFVTITDLVGPSLQEK